MLNFININANLKFMVVQNFSEIGISYYIDILTFAVCIRLHPYFL